MGCVQNHISHCFQLISVKAPIQIMSSAPRKVLMHEIEAEYHERPKEKSPSPGAHHGWMCLVTSPAAWEVKTVHTVLLRSTECVKGKKKQKAFYRYTLPRLIF